MTDNNDMTPSMVDPGTELDQAFEKTKDGNEEATALFYDVLLATTVYLPIWDNESDEDNENVEPRIFQIDDEETMVVFDTLDRLAGFFEEPVSYLELPGGAVIEMIAGQKVNLGINLSDHPSSVILPPKITSWIFEAMQQTADADEIDVRNLTVTRPDVDEGLVAALATFLMRHRAKVSFAVLATIVIAEKSRLALAIVADKSDRMIADNATHLAQSYLKTGQTLEIAWLNDSHPIIEAAERQGIVILDRLKH